MAFQFDLVSPERKLASTAADAVDIPGSQGDFTAMGEHEPVLTTLRPGFIKVTSGSDVQEYLVTGGFVEVSAEAASVLAEKALPKAEVSRETIEEMVSGLEASAATLEGAAKDAATKRIADTKALLDQL